MNDLWIWLAAILLIGALFYSIAHEYQRKQSRTQQEYQQEIREQGLHKVSVSLMRAGFMEIEKMIKPDLQKASEFVQDEEAGRVESQEDQGRDPELVGKDQQKY